MGAWRGGIAGDGSSVRVLDLPIEDRGWCLAILARIFAWRTGSESEEEQ